MDNVLAFDGKRVAANRFSLVETRRNIWQIVPEDGTPYELLFDKDYWAVMASELRTYDRIEVLADNGSFWAELLVLMATKTQAAVMELRKIDISTSSSTGSGAAEVEEEFAVKWRGPHSKWSVIRKTDRSVVKQGFDDAGSARAFALTLDARPVA
jgi:hypothetical protein